MRKMVLVAVAALYVQAKPEQAKRQSRWAQPEKRCEDNSQQELFHRLRHIGVQGHAQATTGPLQDDEALLLFALARVNGVRRVLEVGGLGGFSARTFLEAVACTSGPAVYSVDVHPVPRVGPWHHPIQKSPADLTASDLDTQAVDLILLDCHHYPATTALLRYVLTEGLLAPEGLIALHNTGLHPAPPDCVAPPHECNRTRKHAALVSLQDERLPKRWQWKRGWMHQPVERLVVHWLTKFDCNAEWQTLVAHDDQQRGALSVRHGLTIMQRRVRLDVPQHVCDASKFGRGGVGPDTPAECREVQVPSGKCEVTASTASAISLPSFNPARGPLAEA